VPCAKGAAGLRSERAAACVPRRLTTRLQAITPESSAIRSHAKFGLDEYESDAQA
jgi:hypothetical protein